LSPSNVILSSTGLALVGGAELPEPVWGMEDASGTEHPPLVDGFRYIAPERYEGVSATPASDLYSLGCVLYHAVTGSAPFLGEDPSEVINMHLESEPTAPDKINARLPTPLCDLILCLMNKRPEQRFESAQKALASLAEVEPRQIGPSSVEAAQTAGSALQAFGTARIPDAAGAAAGEAEDLVQLSEEDVVGEAERAGWAAWSGDRWRLTPTGWLRIDELVIALTTSAEGG